MPTIDTTLLAAGVRPGSKLADVVATRADIMVLTQATHEAVLTPRLAGGLTYTERAALACRIARLHEETELTAYYQTILAEAGHDTIATRLADPAFSGDDDRRLTAILRHVDLVTQSPKHATPAHITALKDAGISDADIVRLAELIAFMNYHIRVVTGLRLLGDIV